MRSTGLLALASLVVAIPALAGSNYTSAHAPGTDTYFGHISYCDVQGDPLDPLVVANERADVAVANFPLAPGSRIVTTPGRRCEAQFDTGTVMRLDGATGVRIETILAKALSSRDKLTNIHLENGRLHVLYRDYDGREVFQILTPNAAIKLARGAVVDVELSASGETRVGVRNGGAQLLYGPNAEKTRTRKLKAGEGAVVDQQDALVVGVSSAETDDAFAAWNQDMSRRFAEYHEGRNALPKPIDRYPRAVIEFAQRYSDPHGEWLWNDLYGYVWRPYLNSNVDWRPYQIGRWVPVNAELFWVPDEPWGWVPYHLGLWHWDTRHGWIWIPGSTFAPAWVAWSQCDDAYYFRPLSLYDWNFRRGGYYGGFYNSAAYGGFYNSATYGAGPCGYDPTWNWRHVTTASAPLPAPALSPNPTDDDAKVNPVRWRGDRELPQFPIEVQKAAERVMKRQAGEAENRVAEERILATGAAAQFAEAHAKVELPLTPLDTGGPGRFRDWNGDVRAARRVEGHIIYSSVTNAVLCEGCRGPLKVEWPSEQVFAERSSGSSNAGGGSSDTGGGGSSSSSSAGSASPAGQATRDRIR